jgi:hypothetical protein
MSFSRYRWTAVALVAVTTHANASVVDAKLLDMLLQNGSITAAQHEELAADLEREERTESRKANEKLDRKEFTRFQQTAGWVENTALKGDMRVRNDQINIEDEPKAGGRDRDRQRIRARIGVFTQVNPEVEMGIQIASGNSADRRSTNQDLDTYFDKKPVWLDLGYIDYHPVKVPGLKLFGGKMKQPWMSLGDAVWDTDINPEGFAAAYQRKWGATTLFGSGGYYILKDNVDGDGVEWDNDLGLYAGQIGVSFDAGENGRVTVGGSVYDFNNDGQQAGAPAIAMIANGNTTDEFNLYEGFAQLDMIGLPLPLTVYGQYVVNSDARDFGAFPHGEEDTGWLAGVKTNIGGVALDYNYRDVQRNAVVGYFTDSDFAAGYTGSYGHKLRAQYDFLENFNLVVTYFLATSEAASRFNDKAEVETLMIDLNAKF